MKIIEDLKSGTINKLVKGPASGASEIDTDDSTSYADLKGFVPKHNA
jgi:hypothetical protein